MSNSVTRFNIKLINSSALYQRQRVLWSVTHQNSTPFQRDLTFQLVQQQDHTFQKAEIFTASLLEDAHHLQAGDGWGLEQRVATAVRDSLDLPSETDDLRANHGAHLRFIWDASDGGGGAYSKGTKHHQCLVTTETHEELMEFYVTCPFHRSPCQDCHR